MRKYSQTTLVVNKQELDDITAAINWTLTQPNSLPVEMNKRLMQILKNMRESSEE